MSKCNDCIIVNCSLLCNCKCHSDKKKKMIRFEQCDQCKEYKKISDLVWYPAIKQIEYYADGTCKLQEADERFYCDDCIDSWAKATEGWSYEEWSITQPVRVEDLLH